MQLSRKKITLLGHLSYQTTLPSKKQELNNSVLKKAPRGPQQRVNVKTGQVQITMDGTELLGDECYFVAEGENSKPLTTKCEKRKRT